MDPSYLDPSHENYEYYRRIAFDVTKIWPFNEFPLRPVGKLVLNRNPLNFFDEIEQVRGYVCVIIISGNNSITAGLCASTLNPIYRDCSGSPSSISSFHLS